jgi:hypothetical protein
MSSSAWHRDMRAAKASDFRAHQRSACSPVETDNYETNSRAGIRRAIRVLSGHRRGR